MGEKFCDTFFFKKQTSKTGKNNQSIDQLIDRLIWFDFGEKVPRKNTQQTHPTLSIDRKKCPKYFLNGQRRKKRKTLYPS